MKAREFREVIDYLSDKDNWDPLLRFVAREYLLFGIIVGIILGVSVTTFLLAWSI